MPGISTVSILDSRGVLIIYRELRTDVSVEAMDVFRLAVTSRSRQEKARPPIILIEGVSFMYVKVKDLYFVATTRSNANAALAISYLVQLKEVLVSYLGGDLSEKTIRNNFTLVYELLDETIDYGVPQTTSPDILQLYIKSEGASAKGIQAAVNSSQLTAQITGKTDWRAPNIVYQTNEIYIDVLENVNVLVAVDGTVLKSDVTGEVKLRAYLSGMPECKLALNDRAMVESEKKQNTPLPSAPHIPDITIDDWSFHRCVRLGQFDTDRSIIFVPPDGIFELMKYRVAEHVNLPFMVIPVYEQSSKLSAAFNIRIHCNFPSSRQANNIVVKIPVPPNTVNTSTHASVGKAKYEAAEGAVVWRIKKAMGGSDLLIQSLITMSSSTHLKPWVRPPIKVQFNVNMFTSSGMYVMYLRVIEATGYIPKKYVRYVTRAGNYEYRI